MPIRANALVVMAKAPVPGAVKTRLVPPLAPEQAAELYTALLMDQLEHLNALEGAARYVAFTPDDSKPLVEALVPPGYQCFAQRGGDLGERMQEALGELGRRGHRNLMLMGSDLPPVPLEILDQGFAQLSAHSQRVVLGPSRDGGYYLVGMNAELPEIFSARTWSHERVLAETTEKLVQLGIHFSLLREWFDVDGVADLERLRTVTDPAARGAMKRTLPCLERLSAWLA